MKRVQLFEFEDFQWFPSFLRTSMTNLIVVINKMMGVSDVLAKFISDIAKDHPVTHMVDLGSGAGGAMPEVQQKLAIDYQVNTHLTLTDLYPNADALKKFNQEGNTNLTYKTPSVDETKVEQTTKGLKTMINCFHHMRPEQAKEILTSAKESKEPILIYELTENHNAIVTMVVTSTSFAYYSNNHVTVYDSLCKAFDLEANCFHLFHSNYPNILRMGWTSFNA